MDKKIAGERLRALTSSAKRPKAAHMRDLIDDIETALAAGVPRTAIVEELASLGLDMSLDTFAGTLKRIRKERNKTVAAVIRTGSVESELDKPRVSHDPRDLKNIFRSEPDLDALAKFAKEKKR